MPYIAPEDRKQLEEALCVLGIDITTEGELNYVITRLVHLWLGRVGVNYMNLNAAIGVLECAKQELYRRVVAPYEDQKIAENGDLPGVGE